MCLKTMEKIDKGKDKKHTGKLTSNPEDKNSLYYMSDLTSAWHAAMFKKRYLSERRFRIFILYNERARTADVPTSCLVCTAKVILVSSSTFKLVTVLG